VVAFLACDPEPSAEVASALPERVAGDSVDAERAFEDLRDLVAIGPRPAGSPGAAAARQLIRSRLVQAGWPVREHGFEAQPPTGPPVPMVNLIASLDPSDAGGTGSGQMQPGRILLGTHYDTKRIPGFVGANDGASGVAVVLEVARVLARERPRRPVRLLFFDGEEAFGPSITARDGLYGSRALAAEMRESGELERVSAFLLVDMVGDRDLNLVRDLTSDPELYRELAEVARGLGLSEVLESGVSLALVDDHSPFQEAGLERVLAFLDFQFGAREGPGSSPGPLWHTAGDDLSAVSAQSLNIVTRLVVGMIRRLDRPDAPTHAGR
jgi:Zn-dependent M28 family amino/carboxypeptidase